MSDQIAEIAAAVARIEGILEEGVIKRLDKLNGTQERQWGAITRNRETTIKTGVKLEDTCEAFSGHCDDAGAHGSQTARIRGSSNVKVALVAGAASIVGTGITLLLTHFL